MRECRSSLCRRLNVLSKQIRAQIHLQRYSLFAQGSERASRSGLVSWANTGGQPVPAGDSVCGKGYPRPKGDYGGGTYVEISFGELRENKRWGSSAFLQPR